jgi:TPR repeat protein
MSPGGRVPRLRSEELDGCWSLIRCIVVVGFCSAPGAACRQAVTGDLCTSARSPAELRVLDLECRGGKGTTCAALGECAQSRGDRLAAAHFWSRACSADHGPSCRRLGLLLLAEDARETGIGQDAPKGVKLLEKSCGLGDMEACSALGVAMERGDATGSPGSLYEQACRHGVGSGCTRLARLEKNRKPSARPERVRELVVRACELGDADGCAAAGDTVEDGDATAVVSTRVSFYDQACALGNHRACVVEADLVATGQVQGRDPIETPSLYLRACEASGLGCDELAALYEAGRLVSANKETGRKLREGACNRGQSGSCLRLSLLLEQSGRHVEAKRFAHTGCEQSNAASCYQLAVTQRADGESAEAILATLERACKLGYAPACLDPGRVSEPP